MSDVSRDLQAAPGSGFVLHQSHDGMDFPDGEPPIVIAAIGVRRAAGVIDIVKGSSNHYHD